MTKAIHGLGKFVALGERELPSTAEQKMRLLQNDDIVRGVVCFAAGSELSSTAVAVESWIRVNCISRKTQVVLWPSVKGAFRQALAFKHEGFLPIFWTCVTDLELSYIFSNHPNILPFFINFETVLPLIQLAVKKHLASAFEFDKNNSGIKLPRGWKDWHISSPRSYVHLLEWVVGTGQVIVADSDSEAAVMCSIEKTKACLTTEKVREKHGLVAMHTFGSPSMVFFGGLTRPGIDLLKNHSAIWR